MVTNPEGNIDSFGNSMELRSHAELLARHYSDLVDGGIPPEIAADLTVLAARQIDGLVVRVAK